MKNKKGLSAIVATVLIVLLVIAGVTLLWSPIRNMISDSSEGVEAKCLLADASIESGCTNATNSKIDVTIKNGADEVAEKFQVIFGTSTDMSGSVYTTGGLGLNEEKLFSVANDSEVTQIKIAPYVDGELCDAGPIKTISACA